MGFDARLAQPVAFQANRRLWARPGHLEVRSLANAQNQPPPGRGVPFKPTIAIHAVGQIDHGANRRCLRSPGRLARVRAPGPGTRQGAFTDQIDDLWWACFCRRGHGQRDNGDFPVGIQLFDLFEDLGRHGRAGPQPRGDLLLNLRLVQYYRHRPPAIQQLLAPNQPLHREFGRDVRSSAAVAKVHRHVELQAKAFALAESVSDHLVPLQARARHVTRRRPPWPADFHPQHTAHADALERLQIRRDPLPADIAVDPEPINPGTSGRRWIHETLRKNATSGRIG